MNMSQPLATMKEKRPNQKASYTLAGARIRFATIAFFSSTERTNLSGAYRRHYSIIIVHCIYRCILSLLFILAAHRLKARKFQLVAKKSVFVSTAFSPSFIEVCSHNPSSLLPLPASQSLPLSVPLRDGLFDADVERVRKELKGSDLKRKLDVLHEVWALEVASAGAVSAVSGDDPEN
jgi:hypothetical protein